MPLEIPETSSIEEQNRLLPATLEDRLVRLIGRAGGVVLMALIVATWAMLITWSINDPSLTFATGGRAHNAFGALGAIISDLLLQMLGLATAIALFAPMYWALELTVAERVGGFRTKASFYPLSIVVLAGALSTLPVPQSWPLHHALGGILGDFVANVGAGIFGAINPERAFLATGVSLFTAGIAALLYSIGLDTNDLARLLQATPEAMASTGAAAGGRFSRWWNRPSEEADEEPNEPQLDMPGGPYPAAAHAGYSAHGPSAPYPAHFAGPEGWVVIAGDPQHAMGPAYAYQPYGFHPQHAHPPQQMSAMPGASMPPNQAGGPYDPIYGAPGYMHGHTGEHIAMQPQFEPAPRDPYFEVATDLASRDIAERFAPTSPEARAAAEARSAAERSVPMQAPYAPRNEFMNAAPRGPAVPPQAMAPPSTTRAGEEEAEDAQAPAAPGNAAAPPPASAKSTGFLGSFAFRRAPAAYKKPTLNLLRKVAHSRVTSEVSQTALRGSARLLEDTLADFGVKGEVREIKPGPVVTLYEVEPARGTKSARVIGLADDIARSMSAMAVRVAVVPGRNAIGIELPNARRETVLLREILETEAFRSGEATLPVALGKGIGGEVVVADLARMPHLLVAGTTGSGKSVGVNAMILSLLYRHSPDECRMIMIDPKMLELSIYNGIPHLLTPVVTDPAKAVAALNWAVGEMEERYKRMARLNVRNIDVYNNRVRNAKKRGEMLSRTVQTGFDRKGEAIYEKEEMDVETLPYIVIVVDEFADLMVVAGKEIEAAVQRLAQMARAAGIHLIMATQRPSVDIITGTIKANFPTRISFKVTSKIDSRTILNDQGAEQLLGQGDMLYSTGAGQITRVHGPFVSDEEVEQIAKFLASQGEPKYVAGITEVPEPPEGGPGNGQGKAMSEGDLYDRAVAVVLRDRKPSTSYIQRRLGIGYNRAADLIERMEREGIVSSPTGSGKREILAGEGGGGGGGGGTHGA